MKRLLAIMTAHGRLLLVALLALLAPAGARAQIIINEVMADNQSTLTLTNLADFPDYIELLNLSTNDVSLAEWTLTDDPLNPRRYRFPTNAVILANRFLLVLCDRQTNAPGWHANFELGKSGETVQLWSNNGSLLKDQITFGFQLPDLSIGRVPDGAGALEGTETNWVLTLPTPEDENVAAPLGDPFKLKINEWSASNSGNKPDWFEIYNPLSNVVAFGSFVFGQKETPFDFTFVTNYVVETVTNVVSDTNLVITTVTNEFITTLNPVTNTAIAALSFLGPDGYLQIFADKALTNGNDHVDLKLSGSGQGLLMFDDTRTNVIDFIEFGLQQQNISEGRLPDGFPGTTYHRFAKLTPGESNFQPLTNVVINELLAHTDAPFEDAIELYNPGSAAVDISGWWLSNRKEKPFKYHIPAGTVIPGRGYKVFYEVHFDPDFTGDDPSFRLNSAHGDTLYLFTGRTNDTFLTGFFRGVDFNSAERFVSFGRYMKSDGSFDFTALSQRTFGRDNPEGGVQEFRMGTGKTNAYPKVGPLVINEIHYHPPDLNATNDNSAEEFIEIFNVTSSPVKLYDPVVYETQAPVLQPDGMIFPGRTVWADGRTNTWRLRGGVDYEFPGFPENITLDAGRYLLVVNFSTDATNAAEVSAFRSKFNVPANVPLFGPYRGKLSNGGADVDLYKPDAPQGPQHPDFRFVPHILVDHVKYSDAAPWPTNADGGGTSLQRLTASKYGNDVGNWKSDAPTAGRPSARPPVITRQPQSRTNVAPSTATFTVTVTGTVPFAYQWIFNGAEMGGQTNASLTLANVMPVAGGGYSVVITNEAAAVTSLVATLTVTCPYTVAPAAATYEFIGGSSNITVTTPGGCGWTVENTNEWITILSDTSGFGNATLSYRVGTNNSNFQRTGNIVIGGRTHLVTQRGLEKRPPTVTVTAPPPNARIYTNPVIVRGTAADNIGVARVECQGAEGQSIEVTGTTRWFFSLTLVPGTNRVNIKAVDLAGNPSVVVSRSFFHVETNVLTVVTNALPPLTNRPGTIVPAYNGKYLEIGRGYALAAAARPGWLFSNWVVSVDGVPTVLSAKPTVNFIMSNGTVVAAANFVANPFIPTRGTYNGLFLVPGPVQNEGSGAFTLTMTDRGAYSAKVTLTNKAFAMAGQFDLNGLATNRVAVTRSNGFNVEWQMALTPGEDRITGRVTNGVWEAVLTGDRVGFHAVTNKATNFAGKYTMAIQSGPDPFAEPQGEGYATGAIDLGGNFSIAGVLADNTPFALRTTLSKHGAWPLYAPLYGGKGSLLTLGIMVGNDPLVDLGANLNWSHPALPAAPHFKDYFGDSFTLTGSRYQPPARPTNSVLRPGDYSMTFTPFVGVSPSVPLANTVTLLPNNKLTNRGPGVMTMSLTLSNGVFSGTATLPPFTKPVPFKGVLLQKSIEGRGFLFDTNQNGRLTLTPAAPVE